MSVIQYIKSDLYRYAGNINLISFFRHFCLNRGFNFSFWFRLAKSNNFFVKLIALPIHFYKRRKYGIDISYKTQIGYGFYIGHGGPIVINSLAIIGNNVNVSQYTTIGSNIDKSALIGDNVYIGPNVCIIGNVTIGNNAIIGAGSVVTKDIPQNATAVGNYAKVINYSDKSEYIINKWSI